MSQITLFALHTIEFYRNIGNFQSVKGRMMVKWNWRKSRIISPRENEHLVVIVFIRARGSFLLKIYEQLKNKASLSMKKTQKT